MLALRLFRSEHIDGDAASVDRAGPASIERHVGDQPLQLGLRYPIVEGPLHVAPHLVGAVKRGLLVRVRDFPESILLLDEFEKADNAVGKVLLRVLDEGKAQDSEGNELDFRRCFVILTTNAGVSLQQARRPAGFGGLLAPKDPEEDVPIPIVTRHDLEQDLHGSGLGPEFLARIHHMFFFQAVPRKAIEEIVGDELKALKDQAATRKIAFEWVPELPRRLAARETAHPFRLPGWR